MLSRMRVAADVVSACAGALWAAERSRRPIAPLTDAHPDLTVEDAYAIQSINVARHIERGDKVVGRKIGLTSQAMQDMLGVSEPDFGTILDHMVVPDGGSIDVAQLINPRIEAEIAFIVGSELTGPGVTVDRARHAIEAAMVALEIIDSRIVGWRIQFADTVADNASSGRVVAGTPIAHLDEIDFSSVAGVLNRDGVPIERGSGADVLGNPFACVAWLANELAAFETSLRPGDIVLSGAIHRAVDVTAGHVFEAAFERLGTVTVEFIGEDTKPPHEEGRR